MEHLLCKVLPTLDFQLVPIALLLNVSFRDSQVTNQALIKDYGSILGHSADGKFRIVGCADFSWNYNIQWKIKRASNLKTHDNSPSWTCQNDRAFSRGC